MILIFIGNPSVLNGVFVLVYCFLAWLNRFIPNPKLWGMVVSDHLPVSGLLLELSRPSIPGVIFGKALTNERGKFFLKTSPGEYVLSIKEVGDKKTVVIKTENIQVGKDGVMNARIRI